LAVDRVLLVDASLPVVQYEEVFGAVECRGEPDAAGDDIVLEEVLDRCLGEDAERLRFELAFFPGITVQAAEEQAVVERHVEVLRLEAKACGDDARRVERDKL